MPQWPQIPHELHPHLTHALQPRYRVMEVQRPDSSGIPEIQEFTREQLEQAYPGFVEHMIEHYYSVCASQVSQVRPRSKQAVQTPA